VRRELADRPKEAVTAAVKEWVAGLDPNDPEFERLRCEALWALQRQHAVDVALLQDALTSKSSDARAAMTRLVADERDYLPGALALLQARVNDEHPRVRLEAIRGLSFFPSMEAVDAAILALNSSLDSWLTYTLEHTLGALEPVWRDAYTDGTLAADQPQAREFIADYMARQKPGLAAQKHLQTVLNPDGGDWVREQSFDVLGKLRGDPANGQQVFKRICASCHKVGDMGYVFGPTLDDVGKRLSRRELIDSIIEPNKKVDPKYVTTTILTMEGKQEIGFILEQTADSVTLLQAEGKHQTFAKADIDEMTETNQSSMAENLASTMAPAEFLDVIEYLAAQRGE
jgi:putative heme-binding domain-containing protein